MRVLTIARSEEIFDVARKRKTLDRSAGPTYDAILADVVGLVDAARHAAVRSTNAVMTATYWAIGRRIVEQEQHGAERAGYGEELIVRLSSDLQSRFGRGFGRANVFQMRSFYVAYRNILRTQSGESAPGFRKIQTVSGQSADDNRVVSIAACFPLPWSHYARLLAVRNFNGREFYEAEALRWAFPGENPPVGLILCAEKDGAVAKYALEGLPNKVLAAEYRTTLPEERLLVEEIRRTQNQIEVRRELTASQPKGRKRRWPRQTLTSFWYPRRGGSTVPLARI
jgi:hypothetical protein